MYPLIKDLPTSHITQTQSMLNLLEVMMKSFSFRYLRLDGSTAVNKRQGIIDKFNNDPTVFLMILSTRTGNSPSSIIVPLHPPFFD